MSKNTAPLDDNDVWDEEDEDSQKDKFLTFRIAAEEYGFEIACVTEIVGMQKITEVPDSPPYVKGVINLRGRVIPVLDVRLRFGMNEREYDDRTCVIVVNVSNTAVGLIVDRVSEVLTITETSISLPANIRDNKQQQYVRGLGKVGDSVKILLNVETLVLESENASPVAA
jgi:purine-binding chemotaxis protein CheW